MKPTTTRIWRQSPDEKYIRQQPKLNLVRGFGAPEFMKLARQRQPKFNRGEPIRFLGVAHDCKAFLVYLPKQEKVVKARDIKLNEEWIISQTQSKFLRSVTDKPKTSTIPYNTLKFHEPLQLH